MNGTTLTPQLINPGHKGHVAISYQDKRTSIRTERYRLILHSDGYAELYDHSSSKGETNNIAEDHPKLINQLKLELKTRLNKL